MGGEYELCGFMKYGYDRHVCRLSWGKQPKKVYSFWITSTVHRVLAHAFGLGYMIGRDV